MKSNFNWINIELTSACNKNCACCGRRKIEREYPHLTKWGHMKLSTAKRIASQLPEGIVVSLHNNGEPLMHPEFGKIVKLFHKQIRVLNTNGKLLMEKAGEILGNLDTITVSMIPDDPEWMEQLRILEQFLEINTKKRPRVIIRCTGDIEEHRMRRYERLGCLLVDRILHSPMGSFQYAKTPVIPEHGICNEMLNHPAIDRFGNLSICVRFDPLGQGRLGNVEKKSIQYLWNSKIRKDWLQHHIDGHRNQVPLCSSCEFWGIPRGKK